MTDRPEKGSTPASPALRRPPDRLAREAAALRENLRKRKVQHRARDAAEAEPLEAPAPATKNER
jgi:hypothetical protein